MLNAKRVQCGAPECLRLHTNARQRQFHRKWRERTGENYRTRFDSCYKPGARQRNPEGYARNDLARAARKRGASEVEKIDRLEIFERDHWRCGLCRERVGKKLSWPHPRSASLDHVVPLVAGGSHTRANVQLAHLECNIRKNARGYGEQLALIG
jgi:5-methylcytosine-specific restriction endonuclease McrA